MISVKKNLKGPIYEFGYKVLEERDLAIVWMSVGNSYFKKEVIEKLLNFVADKFTKIRVLAPLEPAEHTYVAIGYPEKKAKKKARLNSNRLKNHSQRIIENITKKSPKSNIQIVDWDVDILPKSHYKKAYKEIKELYKKNEIFKKDARTTTKKVLKNRIKDEIDIEKAVDEGVSYLLEELAFILASPKIFSVKRSAYIYHHKWEIFEKLINGFYDKKIKKNIGFLLIK